MQLFLASLLLASATASGENPIRRIVNLLQMQQEKVEKMGKEQEEMFDKFLCYCQTNQEKLQKSVDDSNVAVPQHESDLKSQVELKAQVDEELKTHKADREDCVATISTATAERQKEKGAFDEAKVESMANIASVEKALVALRKGLGDAFLQTPAAADLQRAVASARASDFDSDQLQLFLQGKMQGSGEIVGILGQMGEEMAADLKEAEEQEASATSDFQSLVGAKQKEQAAATQAIEDKTTRVGELAVGIVNSKNDLADTQAALAEDTGFLSDLKQSCAEQTGLFDQVKKTRADEISAIGECVKILNDDSALDLFKKTMPSPGESFLQMRARTSSRARARALVQSTQMSSAHVFGASSNEALLTQFMVLALRGKKAGFDKVLKMMDEFVTLLGKEQVDDSAKQEYCEKEFAKSEDETEELARTVKSLTTEIADQKEAVVALNDNLASLVQGIKDLDLSVADATETRKEEQTQYMAGKAQNNAAVQLLEAAGNQLAKFYNPKAYKEPERRELTEDERIYVANGGEDPRDEEEAQAAAGGIGNTGVTAFIQLDVGLYGAPPPPPMVVEAYKKQDSSGPVGLLKRFTADLQMEMQEDDMEEKQAQKDYEKLTKQSGVKRAQDGKTIVEKEGQKAEAEARLDKATKSKGNEEKNVLALGEAVAGLHSECDFLVKNFDLRKKARDNEIESIKKAKAVLSGADYSLAQVQSPLGISFLQKLRL